MRVLKVANRNLNANLNDGQKCGGRGERERDRTLSST